MIQYVSWWLFVAMLPMLYWRVPVTARPALLAMASFVVLVVLAPVALVAMLALCLFVYATFAFRSAPARFGANGGLALVFRQLPSGRSWLPVATVFAYLIWYKYTVPFVQLFDSGTRFSTVAIPIGISYFSFKLVHYAIERGRDMLPRHDIGDFLCWVFLMPSFTSGPIERFDHFIEHREIRFRSEFIIEGGTRIAQGLIKKFAILPYVATLSWHVAGDDWTTFAHGPGGIDGAAITWAWLGLELIASYLDFSAYSDIAIGASRLFGLTIMENFNYPLFATNLVDFWRRYHMSLTNWCRAYIYMPLLGSTRNPYVALTMTFVAVGLWHAGTLNWLLWGCWHGLGQAGAVRWGRYAQRKRITFFKSNAGKAIGWAMTMAYVMLGCALEAVHDPGTTLDAFRLMARAFGL